MTPVTRRSPPNRADSLLLLGQEIRGGDQLCELGDQAQHHHQDSQLVHHLELVREPDSPLCPALLSRQLGKDSRLCCRLLAEADPLVVARG